ncbi:MAG: type I 3-dehydroquinate dehydratase [Candidatus Natronoplasma sp.]
MVEIIGTTFVKSTREFAELAKSSKSDIFELRVDALENYDVDDLRDTDKRYVITVRKKEEGGIRKISEEKRLRIFEEFLTVEPSFIDIEFRSEIIDEVLELVDGTSTSSIISYHDFERTPNIDQMNEIFEKMKSKDPDLIKIVTFCKTPKDNSKILEFLLDRSNLVSFCMGKEGMISRIFSLKYCPMTYGSLSERETAPGQLSVEELNEVKEMLYHG